MSKQQKGKRFAFQRLQMNHMVQMDHISLQGVVKAISSVETISNTKVCDWQVKWQASCPL